LRKRLPGLVLLALCGLLVACEGALRWSRDYHTVRAGETLYSIAVNYNVDQRDLIRWNRLGDGTYIREGQKLRLKTPVRAGSMQTSSRVVSQPLLPPPRWHWPTAGAVAMAFGTSVKTESGIRIAGKEDQTVVAVAGGEIVYAGDGLSHYGQLLIIKHNNSWLSAYGLNSSLLVREGDRVRAGQAVARMGREAGGSAQLHFEIRRNGEPVNPLRYLPRR
jgi:lipoprotein NlpD